jgi:PKD repeat protein
MPEHTYTAPGVYTISLMVWDSDGVASACSTTAEIVNPSAVDPTTWGRIKHGYQQ